MAITLDKFIGALNSLAAAGALAQANGYLDLLGPKYMPVAVAVLGLVNAVSHLWPAPATPKA